MIRRGYQTRRAGTGRGGGCGGRLIMAALIAISSVVMFLSSRQDNPITGETQYVDLTVEQEISMGLQAAPEMASQFGGIDANPNDRALVADIGNRIVNQSPAGRSPYEFEFHLLADAETINAFALPGGQIFITRALYDQLQTEGELAGVLGHEIGHVVGRHSAEHIAKAKLTQGLTGAAVIAAYDPNNPRSIGTAQLAALVGQMINMKYGRDDELESDFLGVCFIDNAGYEPSELIRVMEVLAASREGPSPPEFFSTHPNPENRVERIQEAIQNLDSCPQ
jgi:beta-barrel assembly-enhancing protease